jgi:hypothetical protein
MNIVYSPKIPYGELLLEDFLESSRMFCVKLRFHVPVFGLDVNSLSIVNGSSGTFKRVDDNTYLYYISPFNYGLVSVYLAENVCFNIEGVGNARSNVVYFDYKSPSNILQDDLRIHRPQESWIGEEGGSVILSNSPKLGILYSPTIPNGVIRYNGCLGDELTIVVDFHIPVLGIGINSLLVSNGNVSGCKPFGNMSYLYTISIIRYGIVSVYLLENSCRTVDGVANIRSNIFYFDHKSPVNVKSDDSRIHRPQDTLVKRQVKNNKIVINFTK